MNASDSEDDFYNERSALVPSENPVVPSYRPDSDLKPPNHTPSKRVFVFIYSVLLSIISEVPYLHVLNVRIAPIYLNAALCWSRQG